MKADNQKNRSPLCSCGNLKERPNQGYCNTCRNAWARENRPKHSELSDEQKKRANARAALKMQVKRGQVAKEPCKVCQETKVQALIKDYDNPLENLEWLCRDHHHQVRYNLVVPQHEILETYETFHTTLLEEFI